MYLHFQKYLELAMNNKEIITRRQRYFLRALVLVENTCLQNNTMLRNVFYFCVSFLIVYRVFYLNLP
jgi:hypothetical protein